MRCRLFQLCIFSALFWAWPRLRFRLFKLCAKRFVTYLTQLLSQSDQKRTLGCGCTMWYVMINRNTQRHPTKRHRQSMAWSARTRQNSCFCSSGQSIIWPESIAFGFDFPPLPADFMFRQSVSFGIGTGGTSPRKSQHIYRNQSGTASHTLFGSAVSAQMRNRRLDSCFFLSRLFKRNF